MIHLRWLAKHFRLLLQMKITTLELELAAIALGLDCLCDPLVLVILVILQVLVFVPGYLLNYFEAFPCSKYLLPSIQTLMSRSKCKCI